MRQIEKSYNTTLDLLIAENDKIMSTSLTEAIQIEANKIGNIHKAEIDQKQKLYDEQVFQIKQSLLKETQQLEEQLKSQTEMKQMLERVQQRTVEVGDIVQNSLKQREEELARREAEISRQERDLFEEESVEVQMLEKRI